MTGRASRGLSDGVAWGILVGLFGVVFAAVLCVALFEAVLVPELERDPAGASCTCREDAP